MDVRFVLIILFLIFSPEYGYSQMNKTGRLKDTLRFKDTLRSVAPRQSGDILQSENTHRQKDTLRQKDSLRAKNTLQSQNNMPSANTLLKKNGSRLKDTLQVGDTPADSIYVLQYVERNGVTLPEVPIKEVTIVGRQKGSSPRRARSQLRQYQRLIYNLKKTYPYAVIAREKLAEINARLEELPDEKSRKQFLNQQENNILAEFEDDARSMTITQGRLLIKLIDRETLNTSYELIRQYRGFLSATFWQTVARIFGSNLKDEYDPYGEDALIEMLILDIEAGLL